MAEMLVRVNDKVHADFYLNTKCTKRADVIVIKPDGWAWGTQELTSPDWLIVKLPNLSVDDLSGFLAPEVDTDPTHPSKTLQRRAFKIDLAQLALDFPVVANFISGGFTRKRDTITTNVTLTKILTYLVQKAPIADPNVIGGSPAVIG